MSGDEKTTWHRNETTCLGRQCEFGILNAVEVECRPQHDGAAID